jgi:hypothetical protein
MLDHFDRIGRAFSSLAPGLVSPTELARIAEAWEGLAPQEEVPQ